MRLKKRLWLCLTWTTSPEGPDGIIIYCMLRSDALKCPDLGDFNYLRQGYEKIVRISFDVISEETRWFGSSAPSA